MKNVCVLLPWTIAKDSRAQRTVRTMARHAKVHIYHVPGEGEDPSGGMAGVPGVRVVPVPRRETRLDWALRHTLYFLDAAFLASSVLDSGEPYSVVYAHDLPSAWPARRIAARTGARILYDVHDLYVETVNQGFPETATSLKRLKHGFARWSMRSSAAAYERRFVRNADLVVTTTGSYLGYLESRYGLAEGLVLPNYPERREVARSNRLFEACKLPPGSPVALYHGSFGKGRFLEEIVNSAAFLADGSYLVLVGGGHLEGALRSLASSPGLRERIRFHDFVPYGSLLEMASGASLGLILIDHINLSKEYALANKLTEYMASGVAVLASDSPENRRILDDAHAGHLLRVTSPQALGARIRELLSDRESLAALGENGRRAFLDRYHWEAVEPAFERAFLRLLEGR